LILSFDLKAALRRWKPARHVAPLKRRSHSTLPFVTEDTASGLELLLDTCVYVDVLQDRLPEQVERLMAARLCNHSGVALAELTHLLGRLDPRDRRTEGVLKEIAGVVAHIPAHRSNAPSVNALGEAGILAGVASRLGSIESAREQALLNDAILYLQAVESGQIILTRNVREFDFFDQLLPRNCVLFYAQT
jgi:hypothetical protein